MGFYLASNGSLVSRYRKFLRTWRSRMFTASRGATTSEAVTEYTASAMVHFLN